MISSSVTAVRALFGMAVSAMAVLVLGACAVGQTSGPLVYGDGSEREVCVDPAPGERYLVGDTPSAPDDADVSVEDVRLVGARGLVLEDAVFVPLIERVGIGTLAAPPDRSEAWRRRAPAVGFSLPRGTVGNLVVIIRRTGDADGFAQGVAVDYRADGVRYSKTGTLAIRAQDVCG